MKPKDPKEMSVAGLLRILNAPVYTLRERKALSELARRARAAEKSETRKDGKR